MLCTLLSVSAVAIVFIIGAVAVAAPIGKANIFVVKRAIFAITAITIAAVAGVIVDGVYLKGVSADKSPHIPDAGVFDSLAKKNESNLLAPKPDSVVKKLFGRIESKDAPLRGAD